MSVIDNGIVTLWIEAMSLDHIPIELDRHGISGTIRQEGFPGESLPDLIAHRPEAWRFLRLARIVGAARAIARDELGADEAKAMTNAMVSVADYKGDFGVIWRHAEHKLAYEKILDRALVSEGEVEFLHVMDSDQ